MRYLVDGLGETAGGDLLLGVKPVYSYNNIWYVNSVSGTDAAWAGTGPERPCKTVGYALNTLITGGVENDIIVLAPEHDETLTVGLNFTTGGNRDCTIIGVGTTAGKPSAKLHWNNAAGSMFTTDRAGVEFRNIHFCEKVVNNATETVRVRRACRFTGCWFDCGVHDTGVVVGIDPLTSAAEIQFYDCTFVSTAPTCTIRPLTALASTGGASYLLYMDGVTFDGGPFGFAGFAFNQAAAPSNCTRCFNVALLGGADVNLNAATVGWIHVSEAQGGARVVHP